MQINKRRSLSQHLRDAIILHRRIVNAEGPDSVVSVVGIVVVVVVTSRRQLTDNFYVEQRQHKQQKTPPTGYQNQKLASVCVMDDSRVIEL